MNQTALHMNIVSRIMFQSTYNTATESLYFYISFSASHITQISPYTCRVGQKRKVPWGQARESYLVPPHNWYKTNGLLMGVKVSGVFMACYCRFFSGHFLQWPARRTNKLLSGTDPDTSNLRLFFKEPDKIRRISGGRRLHEGQGTWGFFATVSLTGLPLTKLPKDIGELSWP